MSASKQFPGERGSFFSIEASSDKLQGTSETERFQERLREITQGERKDTGRIKRLLQLGAEWLEVEGGYLSEIDPVEGAYEITATGGPDPPVSTGETADLSSTYCRAVIAEGEALAIENAPEQGWGKDPAYETFGLSTYLGAKVVVEDKLRGTVCFAEERPREEPFDESDAAALALIAWAIEEELEKSLRANLSGKERVPRKGEGQSERASRPVRLPYEALFEQSPDMVAVYDLGGSLLATNHRLREQTGFGADTLAQMGISDLDETVGPDAVPWRELKRGEQRRIEGRYRRADGTAFPVEVTLRRLELKGAGRVVATARSISHRKRRARQLDAIVSNTSNPIYIKDREGRYQFVNEGASALFDEEPAEVIGKSDEDLFDPESAADIRAEDKRVMETAETLKKEAVRYVDGTEHVYLDNKYPYRDEEGVIVGVVGISRDITRRKGQQRKLRDAKDLLETTFDSLQEAVVVVDGSKREIILCNGATEEIFGYEKEELIGAGTKKLHVDSEAYEDFGEVSERALEEDGVFRGEYRMRRKDGRVIETEHTVTPLRGEKWPSGAVSVVRDVTERNERERRLRAIFNQTYQFTGLLETDGTLIEANDTALEFGGLEEEDVLGKPVWETDWFDVGEKTKERLRESVRRSAEGEFIRYEMEVEGAEERRIIDFSLRPIEGKDGEVTLIIPEGRDITERKRAEEALREQEAQLRGLANSLPGPIFQFFARPGGTYGLHFVSEQAEELLGISADPDGFFERFRERIPTFHREAFEKSVGRAVDEEKPWRQELPFDRPDGERIWLLGASSPHQRDGETVFNGVLLDITDRREARQALRKERDRFVTLFENLPSPVVRGEPDESGRLRILGVNAAFESTFGLSREEANGEDIQTLIVPPEEKASADSIRRRLLAGERVDREVRREAADGLRDFRVQVTLREESGEPVEGYAIYTDITRRKKRERKLAEQRALLEAQAESTIDGILAVSEEREVAFYNERFLDIWEVPENVLPEDPVDEPLEQVFLKHATDLINDPEAFRREVQRLYDDPEQESRDLIHLTDGRWVDRYSAPIVGEDEPGEGKAHFGRLWIFRDVTDREERRRKIEALYSATDRLLRAENREDVGTAIAELIRGTLGYPGVTVRFAREGTLVPAHVSLETDDFMSERPPVDITAENKVAEAFREGETIVRDDLNEISDIHDHGKARSGAVVPIHEHGTIGVTGRETGAPDAADLRLIEIVAAHAIGVLDRIEHEESLRESERRFRKLFEEAPVGMARVSRDGKLLETNEAFRRILGYEAEALRGRHFETLTYEEDIGKARAEFEDLIAGGRPRYTIEKRYRRGNGEVFWARLTASLFQHEGETQVIGMVEDIDDQKRYEEGLRKAKEAAEEANRMKSAFLANMSHEIRTPLTSIIGFAEAIGEEIGDEEGTAGRFARLIESSGHRLMETLDGVLNLSKLEGGAMDVSLGPVNVAREVEAMAEELGPQTERAGVDLRVETTGEPVWAEADEQALQIAMRNLVSNGIKYAGKEGTVTVRAYEEEKAVALEVEDDGIGIETEEVERLFEPFRQESEGRARAYEGTGIGLTVTKKAVGQMGGSIDVDTEKGRGSRFTVWLPRAEGEEEG
jgi:PAS domain S-box-containing protein